MNLLTTIPYDKNLKLKVVKKIHVFYLIYIRVSRIEKLWVITLVYEITSINGLYIKC